MLDIPCYSQTDTYSCGAIAAWSVVETFKPRANFWKFYQAVQPDPETGSTDRQVLSALRKFKIGYRVRRNLGWPDLVKAIDDGFPMLIGTGKENSTGDHWSLLYGYGTRHRKVYLANQIGVLRNQIRVEWGEVLATWWNPVGMAIVCWG